MMITVHDRRARREGRLWLAIFVVIWITLLLLVSHPEACLGDDSESHVLVGYAQGTRLFGSDEAKPAGLMAVWGATNERGLLGLRRETEFQLSRHWQGLAVGGRLDLGEHWHLLLGTGAGRLEAERDWQRDGFNFLLQGGVGVRHRGWRADLRLHHISNARLRLPNTGTNAVLLLVGRSW